MRVSYQRKKRNHEERLLSNAKPKLKMTEENNEEIIELFKKRGISCADLERKENQRLKLAKEARGDGFNETARLDEELAKRYHAVRKNICKLK